MKVSFIGNGGMTKSLAMNWSKEHDIFISGRNEEKSKELANALDAKFGSIAQAIDYADVIILAVPADAAEATLAENTPDDNYASKIIIDISNPVSPETFTTTREDRSSVTETVEKMFPKAHFAKAFNMAHTSFWEMTDKTYSGELAKTLYTADNVAKEAVEKLINDTGTTPVLVGDNKHAYQLEAAAAMVIKFLFSGSPGDTILNFVTQK